MQQELEQVWNIEQDILDQFHDFCITNHLKYSLTYGTLLGAVRHGGFIPWDDDLDVMMPRDDYNKFITIWPKSSLNKEYILQNYKNTKDFTNNFSKIRKNNTAFYTEFDKNKSYHKGIFIDIFPVDKVAPSKFSKSIQLFYCAINLLFSRGYTSKSNILTVLFERILLKLFSHKRNQILSYSEKKICKWNKINDLQSFIAVTIHECNVYLPSDLFSKMKDIVFNNKKYMVINNPENLLRILYGNYMELPPIEERRLQHTPLFIDTQHNFSE